MTESNTRRRVAVIGLGNMGSALAEALLAKGHEVTVWNRTAAKAEPLVAAGATLAPSVTAAAAAADVVVVCVIDHDASTSLLQAEGVAEALRGKLLVQLSTVTAEQSCELGAWADERGIGYLDGLILAYPQGVRDNRATVVYSGPKDHFAANEGLLAAMGGNPKLVRETLGGAPIFGLSVYAWHYGYMLAFFHGAAICHAAGFPIEVYVDEALSGGGATARRYGERIAKRYYDEPACMINVHAAAYAPIPKLCEGLGVDAALPQTVARIFERAIADGHGNHDLPAIFETLLNERA